MAKRRSKPKSTTTIPAELAGDFGNIANGADGEVQLPEVKKSAGRPVGSETRVLQMVQASPSVCVRPGCQCTEREVLKRLPDVTGSWIIDGTPRNVMQRRRVRCTCGQQRIETSFHFAE